MWQFIADNTEKNTFWKVSLLGEFGAQLETNSLSLSAQLIASTMMMLYRETFLWLFKISFLQEKLFVVLKIIIAIKPC